MTNGAGVIMIIIKKTKTLAAIKAVKSIQISFFLRAEINQGLRGEECVLRRGKKNLWIENSLNAQVRYHCNGLRDGVLPGGEVGNKAPRHCQCGRLKSFNAILSERRRGSE